MIGEGQADGATVPDPEPDPSLHPESVSPTLDEATLRQWSAANPQKNTFVPIVAPPQLDAEARLKEYEIHLAERNNFEINTYQEGLTEALRLETDAVQRSLLAQAQQQVDHHAAQLAEQGEQILRAEHLHMRKTQETAELPEIM